MPWGRNMRITQLAGFGAVLLVGLTAVSQAAKGPSVAGTPHDLSGRGATAGNEICTYCHTPTSPGAQGAALWAGHGPSGDNFALFGIRVAEMPVDGSFMSPPRGVTMVCLSCHDGVTAWDSLFANPKITTAAARRAASAIVGGVSGDHPVSVDYPPPYDPSMHVGAGQQAGDLPLFSAFGGNGGLNRVECASCHNPHSGRYGKFLRAGTAKSGLCRNCHVK